MRLQLILWLGLALLSCYRVSSYRIASQLTSIRSARRFSRQSSLCKQHTSLVHPPPVIVADISSLSVSNSNICSKAKSSLSKLFHSIFIPSGLSNNYQTYVRWRFIQRIVSSVLTVFGTQSMLLSLGFKHTNAYQSAVSSWILKDILGKLSRIIWASKYGIKFDTDVKYWRWICSVMYTLGNVLEMGTFIRPQWFLVLAALSNSFKQIAYITYSSTRNSIYRSFSRHGDNIGDITAKGESQIALTELIGMFIGIGFANKITNSQTFLKLFLGLTLIDIILIFFEIRSLVFESLNFERTEILLNDFYQQSHHNIHNITLKSPLEASRIEKIYLPAKYSQKMVSQDEKDNSIRPEIKDIFHNEKFIVNIDIQRMRRRNILVKYFVNLKHQFGNPMNIVTYQSKDYLIKPKITLKEGATNEDIFQALTVLHYVLYNLRQQNNHGVYESADCIDLIRDGYQFELKNREVIKQLIISAGWNYQLCYGTSAKREDS